MLLLNIFRVPVKQNKVLFCATPGIQLGEMRSQLFKGTFMKDPSKHLFTKYINGLAGNYCAPR